MRRREEGEEVEGRGGKGEQKRKERARPGQARRSSSLLFLGSTVNRQAEE